MTAKLDYVHCMLIPLREHYLLLPNTTIAEVTPLPSTVSTSDIGHQDFILGECHWRDKILPVIDLENLIGQTATEESRTATKLCVLNGINQAARVPHYALPCCGAPQLITLNEAALQISPQQSGDNWLHCQIKIGSQIALLPNLDQIENHLQNQLATP